jgi:hypothetical protein
MVARPGIGTWKSPDVGIAASFICCMVVFTLVFWFARLDKAGNATHCTSTVVIRGERIFGCTRGRVHERPTIAIAVGKRKPQEEQNPHEDISLFLEGAQHLTYTPTVLPTTPTTNDAHIQHSTTSIHACKHVLLFVFYYACMCVTVTIRHSPVSIF